MSRVDTTVIEETNNGIEEANNGIEETNNGVEEANNERVCFICMENGGNQTKCACKNQFAHDLCLIKWVQTANDGSCKTCRKSFNIKVEHKTTYRVSRTSLLMIILSVLLLLLLGCIIFLMFQYGEHSHSSWGTPILVFNCIMIAFVGGSSLLLIRATINMPAERRRLWRPIINTIVSIPDSRI